MIIDMLVDMNLYRSLKSEALRVILSQTGNRNIVEFWLDTDPQVIPLIVIESVSSIAALDRLLRFPLTDEQIVDAVNIVRSEQCHWYQEVKLDRRSKIKRLRGGRRHKPDCHNVTATTSCHVVQRHI